MANGKGNDLREKFPVEQRVHVKKCEHHVFGEKVVALHQSDDGLPGLSSGKDL